MSKLLKNLKKKITVFAITMIALQPVLGLAMLPTETYAAATPETLVEWNFPSDPDDATADDGITANLAKTISTDGGTSAIAYNTAGATTNSARATDWDSGLDTKFWQVEFSTQEYKNISFSSKQRSSSTGPKDFKVEYKIGVAGTWADVTGSTVTTEDNYTSGILLNVSLPSTTQNKALVYLRWIMTSNTAVDANPVTSGGESNIDDIIVTGVDTKIPEITGTPSNIIKDATSVSGAVVDYTPPTANDNVDGEVEVSCTPPSGYTFPIAVTTVTCTATDNAGNMATKTFTVTVTSPVVDTPVAAGPTAPTATLAVAEVPVDEYYGGSSEQGEVMADTAISQDTGNNTENKDEQKEDEKSKKNIPLWGIIFLLILAGIGGYLFYSQSPEKANRKK